MSSMSVVSSASFSDAVVTAKGGNEPDRLQNGRQFIASFLPETTVPAANNGAVDQAKPDAASKLKQKEKLAGSIDIVSQFASVQNLQLQFIAEEHHGNFVVQVVDQESKKVIRQIPSQEFLKVAEKIQDIIANTDQVKGLLFESKV